MQVMGIGFLWKVSMLSLRDGLRNIVCIIRSQLSWFRHLTRMVAEHLLRKMFWACLTRGTLMKTQSSLFTYSQYHYFLFLKIHSIGIVFDSYVIIVSGCHWKVLFTHWWVKAVAAVRAVVLLIVILVTSFTSVLFVFKCLGKFGPLRCGEMYALDRLLREARVLEIIRRVTKENPQKIRPATEGDLCRLCSFHVHLFKHP